MASARESATLPDGFATAGFSLGCIMAVHVATQRPVSGVLMVAGAIPASALGNDVQWPQGSLCAEYDPDATETLWERALPFIRACG